MMLYLLYSSRDATKYYIQREQDMNTENMNAVICVFCETIVADKIDYSTTQYCEPCFDYKGLTTVGEYLQEYGLVNA